jgi:hypothetical protein
MGLSLPRGWENLGPELCKAAMLPLATPMVVGQTRTRGHYLPLCVGGMDEGGSMRKATSIKYRRASQRCLSHARS